MDSILHKIKAKIVTARTLKKKNLTGKMVFTNGCFDILHKGHIHYLAKAAGLGDYLVIGLNSDKSVNRLKGEGRPVQDELSRSLLIAGLSFVDYVIIFNEDTPLELIKELKPDILVKGGDYKAEDIVGYDEVRSHGGDVKIIEFIEGYSSSKIIDKLKA